jgi:arsenite methyltransferase
MADAEFWNQLAEKYAAQPVKDVRAFDRKKAITREHLQPRSTILELGCGTGSLALELARDVEHIHAVDVSAGMIRIAEKKKIARGVTNVTFHTGTLDAVQPRLPEEFDAVWAYSILHLVDDRAGTLQTAFQLLKPGGTFISSNVCLAGTWVPYRSLIALMRWFGKAPRVHCHDRKTILREIAEAGFVDIEDKDVGTSRTVAFVVAKKPA